MYTKILAQGTKFGSGTTGLDNPDVLYNISAQEERTRSCAAVRALQGGEFSGQVAGERAVAGGIGTVANVEVLYEARTRHLVARR